MSTGETYWSVIEPVWEAVSIYDGPETFLDQFSKISAAQRQLLSPHWCQSEVRNGGFHQFFHNPTGVLAPEASAGFRAIGLEECADLVDQAMRFFGEQYPRDQSVRQAALDEYGEVHGDLWDPFVSLDDQFFDAIEVDGYDIAADRFATRHAVA